MAKKEKLSLDEKLEQALAKDEDQPYSVPKNWVWTRLGEITTIIGGGTPSTSVDEYYSDGDIAWITPADLSGYNDMYISCGKRNITKLGLKKSSARLLPKDTVIMSSRAPIGYVAIALNELSTNQGFKSFLPSSIYNPKYLYYYLIQNKGLLESFASGTTFLELSGKKASQISIPIPPLPEQQRIVDLVEPIFEKLDHAKELSQNALDSFENRKSAILHKAFTGELTAKWREENRNISNGSLKEILEYYTNASTAKDTNNISEFQSLVSIIKEIDNGRWYKCSIGAIGVVCNGSTPSRRELSFWCGDIPWVSSGEVKNNIINVTNECITNEGFNNSSVRLLKKGSVLIAMIGEGKTRGQTAILNIDATINQNIAAIDLSHNAVESKYVWYWLQYQYRNNREEGNGTGPKALNCQRVRELNFILPPLPEQKEIVRILDNLLENEQNAKELCDVIDKIELMKKSILARAFRGELSTNNPHEESALELLKEVLRERAEG